MDYTFDLSTVGLNKTAFHPIVNFSVVWHIAFYDLLLDTLSNMGHLITQIMPMS
ncbi:MAG: hypothetical protein F6K09_29725 [Merismopedia sp. SIO2A8]|nr:hypothetical protein [Merismopedia sp. SIO2A8]